MGATGKPNPLLVFVSAEVPSETLLREKLHHALDIDLTLRYKFHYELETDVTAHYKFHYEFDIDLTAHYKFDFHKVDVVTTGVLKTTKNEIVMLNLF